MLEYDNNTTPSKKIGLAQKIIAEALREHREINSLLDPDVASHEGYAWYIRTLLRVPDAALLYLSELVRDDALHEARLSKRRDALRRVCEQVVEAWEDRARGS